MQWTTEAWSRIHEKVKRTSQRIGATFPHVSRAGQYDDESADWWTNGFWPGLLWILYQDTKHEPYKAIAEQVEQKLDEPLHQFVSLHHDVGFMWSLSSVANYKVTGHEASKTRALIAASHLAGRFNLAGQFIRAWPREREIGWTIIDCMMNLGILFWASEATKDPRFKQIAMAHADTVLEHFMRADGSVHHIVSFDPNTGERIEAFGGQGYAPESSWSRGQSWALYGFAICYRYTKQIRYLDAAKRVAHYFIANLRDDAVSDWDFRAPETASPVLDTSATACAASGLIEISRYLPELEAALYLRWGNKMLKALYEQYGAWDQAEEGLVMMATGHYTANSNINIPHIYGDYFFVEGIAKLRGKDPLFW